MEDNKYEMEKAKKQKVFPFGVILALGCVAIAVIAFFSITQDRVWGVENPTFSQPTSYYTAMEKMAKKGEVSDDALVDIVSIGYLSGPNGSGSLVSFHVSCEDGNGGYQNTEYRWNAVAKNLEIKHEKLEKARYEYRKDYAMTFEQVKEYFTLMENFNLAEKFNCKQGYPRMEMFQFDFASWDIFKVEDFERYNDKEEAFFLVDNQLVSLADISKPDLEKFLDCKIARVLVITDVYEDDKAVDFTSYEIYMRVNS